MGRTFKGSAIGPAQVGGYQREESMTIKQMVSKMSGQEVIQRVCPGVSPKEIKALPSKDKHELVLLCRVALVEEPSAYGLVEV